ncbi:MAG TPA: dihydrofolate reductase family protein [Polyangiaceae bacterium]|nr:dihydrofolate reductase family protein [Polyangiaceae bacterium]
MTANLVYFVTRSLDGYIEDDQGKIDWAPPDEERLRFVNDALRPVGTHVYGRRMYETMQVWTEFGSSASDPPWARDFAGIWGAADKIVYSKTLTQVSAPRTRLEHTFDVDAIRELKLRAARDLVISGHELATLAFRAGLVDEIKLFIAPIILGGGKKALPDGVRLGLELVDERRFEGSGIVYLHYRRPTA